MYNLDDRDCNRRHKIYNYVSRKRRGKMTYKLFEEVILLENIPENGLKKGDVATMDIH